MKLRDRLEATTGGASATPLAVLFGLNFVDELDQILFGIVTPEIRNDLGLSDQGIIVIGSLVAVFVLLAVMPLTYLADRFNRVRLVFFAALGWMSMSVLTGLSGYAGILFLLVIARMGSGLGRTVNDPVHASLLTDYYEPAVQPKVFEVHRAANPLSRVTAVLIGAGAGFFGWQAMFIVLALPTVFLVAAALRLPEPRHKTVSLVDEVVEVETVDDGDERTEAQVSFFEARRVLFGIPSMKRLYVGSFLLGFGFITLGTILSLFFEDIYGFSPTMRGVAAFFAGVGALAGLNIGQRMATSAMADARPERLATITGLSFTAGALGLILMAVSPWAAGSLLFSVLASSGFSAFQPAYYPLVGMITPARVRTQAYGWSLILVGIGGLVGSVLIGGLAESSYRTAVAGLAVVVGLAGAVGASASRFVRRDVDQAARALSTAAELEAAREAGEGTVLICRGVEVAYDQVQVLFGVDMDVRPGEIVALLGTNGAGKSTLLKAISGVVDPIGGAIWFDGADITHTDAVATVKAGIVQVPGGKAVFPTLTVAEHLRAGGWLYRDDPDYLDAATEEVYEIFPRLRERRDQMAGNLSGGEQQMLALGMAFIAKPKLLMIDELSLGLAPTIVEQLLGIVRRIKESGTAIILVEQSINVALTVAERAYFLEKGEVRFEGPTADLLERDDIVRSVFLEGAGGPSAGTGAQAKTDVTTERRPIGEPILELYEVRKNFGGVQAVTGATFTLNEHEILGLIGPNGAGKTTIFDLISGFLTTDSGRIVFDGEDVTDKAPDKRAWLGLGRSFQDARLIPSLTVAENIAIGLERFIELRDPVASALGLPGIVRQEEDVAWTVEDLIEMMHLGAFRDKFVRELSTGSRRIVDLAMCIAHDPKVLLLDEPSSGIAQKETEALAPLLRTIQDETGCALLIIEHDMPLITGLSDRMIALELGAPIVEGTPTEVTSDPRVVSSYLGGDLATINRSGASAPAVEAAVAGNGRAPSNGHGNGRRRREPLVADRP
jgi:branched-chain amino acid transport system ATP-binding protein